MIVYLARNRANGKGYVGKTKRSLEQRIKEHLTAARMGADQLFGRALRKHGPEAFDWEVLVELTGDDESLLDQAERSLIEAYEIYAHDHPNTGYNLTRGGDGVKGLKHTEDAKRRMSEARKGEKNHNFGKDWGYKGLYSEESKQKMRDVAVGRKHSEETKYKIALGAARPKVAIPVHQLDTEGNVVATFESVHKACQAHDVWPYGIKACCEGRRQTYAGFGWKFAKE